MSEHDRSLFDRVKDAFGMGDDDRTDDRTVDRHRDDEAIQTERPAETAEPAAGSASEASGWEGASGGMGASGAMGGAGAAGPVGATPPSDASEELGGADPGDVRTEYEMGHEFDPDHETRAESGVLDESASGSGGYSAAPRGGGSTLEPGTQPSTRGEAASGESPFDDPDERRRAGDQEPHLR